MQDDTEQGGSGGGFQDPTAPTWSAPDPTQPLPTPPPPMATPSPYAAPQPYAPPQPYEPWAAPPAPGQVPHDQAPYGHPSYGQPPSGPPPYGPPPYGQAPYGQAPYGQGPYAQPPYPMAPAPYGPPPQKNTSAIVLTVVSAISIVSCCNLLAIAPLVLGIMGLSRAGTDPQGAARSTRAGWITFGITTALVVIGWVVFFALATAGTFDGSATYDYGEL